MLSYQIVAVTVGWHIYEITRNPFSPGWSGWPRCCRTSARHRSPAIWPITCHAANWAWPPASGWSPPPPSSARWRWGGPPFKGVWPIYLAIALTGMVRAFLSPVYNGLFPQWVLARGQYARGAGFGSVVFQCGMVLGPGLGGVLVGWGSKGLAYGVAALMALLALGALALLRVAEAPPPQLRAPIFASIAEGVRFVLATPVMPGAMALDMFSVLLGGVVAMPPAFIHEILHYGPQGLGILRAAPALGSVCVGLWLARHPLHRNAGRTLLFAVAGFGLCVIGFGLSRALLAVGGDPAVLWRRRRRLGGGALDHPAIGHAG